MYFVHKPTYFFPFHVLLALQSDMSQSENQENLWIPIYQMYQKDQDQISDATYISDAVLVYKHWANAMLQYFVRIICT